MATNRIFNKSVVKEGGILSYVDPLAQSFIIERPSILTKVDFYFFAKDTVLPVNIDIRKMLNGTPSTIVLPFSETSLPAANILTSANSLVATSVNFTSPVYVEPGEYCLTLFSDSNKTKVWISQLAETDVATGVVIQKQPSLGVLFKSQNGSTWTPDQLQDLKFTLYRAKFTPGQTATIELWPGEFTSQLQKLPYDALEVYPQSSTMKVYHPNHGFKDGSTTMISEVDAHRLMGNVQYFGLYPANISGIRQVVSNVTLDTYTVSLPYAVNSNVTSITRFGKTLYATSDFKFTDSFPAVSILKNADSTVVHSIRATDTDYVEDTEFSVVLPNKDYNFDTVKVLPSAVNRDVSMTNARSFTYKIEMSTNETYVAPIIDLGKSGIVLYNNKINNPTYQTEHKVSGEERIITTGNTTSFTNLTTNTGTVDLANTNARANAVNIAKGTTLRILGANNASNVRVLDVLNNGANILVYGTIVTESANSEATSNVVIISGSKFIAEEAASGGSAMAKYITRPLNFINPSTAFKFFLDVSKPYNTNIKFYYRTSLVGDTSIITDKEFIEITGTNIADSLSGEFFEIEKLVDSLESFDGLQFKIVFLSDDITKVPKCRNLRLVAIA